MAKASDEKILAAALDIFARDGYLGANIKDISAAVGLVKSAFYRHFESKEEVWNAVMDEMESYYYLHFGSSDRLPPVPKSVAELKALSLSMLDFTIHDEKIIKTRKILLTEQFRSERIRDLATKHFCVGLSSIFEKLFAGMMDNGSLRCGDPAMLAFAYTTPISALVQLCDRNPDSESEVMEQIEKFINHFIETYGL